MKEEEEEETMIEHKDRRRFLRQASLLVMGAQARAVVPLTSATAQPRSSGGILDVPQNNTNQGEALYIDHVIYAVRDIEAAKEHLLREFGLIPVWTSTYSNGREIWRVLLEPPQHLELIVVVGSEIR